MNILILDDDIIRLKAFKEKLIGHNVVTTMTASEAIKELSNNTFELLFLDHDLGNKQMEASGPGTGYEVALWLSEKEDKQPDIIVIHSYNPVGARNMANLLPRAKIIPGIWTYPQIIKE